MYVGDSMPLLLTFPKRRGHASPHRAEGGAWGMPRPQPLLGFHGKGRAGGATIEGRPVGVMIAGFGAQGAVPHCLVPSAW